ncbi:hypothetical protein [Paracoccus beibuensis]|uniref:hypothetical protein n=1 Tax=Paracoccus beibuensis TaxID=547602 RepID=UPI00223FD7D2|nr:hypothetical protein [Paracoccus beibuensis]
MSKTINPTIHELSDAALDVASHLIGSSTESWFPQDVVDSFYSIANRVIRLNTEIARGDHTKVKVLCDLLGRPDLLAKFNSENDDPNLQTLDASGTFLM